jgi:hypothetical protein
MYSGKVRELDSCWSEGKKAHERCRNRVAEAKVATLGSRLTPSAV